MIRTDFAVGFAMGFIAGEGCFTGDRLVPSLAVKVVAADILALATLVAVFGGRIYGPYPSLPPRQPVAVWRLSGRQLAAALDEIAESMPQCRKRQQFEAWRLRWGPYFERLATSTKNR